MHQDLFDQLESRIMNWFDSLNNQNTRDTPADEIRMPPFLLQDSNGNFSLKTVDPNNPTPIDNYLLPLEFANQTISPDQQADLRERVYDDVVNTRRNYFGGKRRKKTKKRTKKPKSKKSKSKKSKSKKSK